MKGGFPGGSGPLEKGMATHTRILGWKIPRTEEPDRLYSPWGHNKSDIHEEGKHKTVVQKKS